MAATIQDIQTLGYTVGMAHGSVQVEQDALAAAKEAADPNVVAQQVNQVTADTVQVLDKLGRLPETPEERLELATQIGKAALEGLSAAVSERVAFHERALSIAQQSPDVWCVQQFAGDAMIVQTYVSCKADGSGWDEDAQAHCDALADKPSYAEREYQGLNPEAMQAASTLAGLGRSVSRPSLGADSFTVDGATVSGADLLALAEKAAAEPAPPSPAEKIVAALADSTALSPETQQALQEAVAQPDSAVAASPSTP